MNRQNRRQQMEKKRAEFLHAFEQDVEDCTQSLDAGQSLSEQDQRLTTKHIKTLTFLQDIVNENKTLKARNEQLEKEMSECQNLHEIAREAPDRLKEMEEEYRQKMIEINQLLLDKHESELTRIVKEKSDLEKTWQTEKLRLENEIENLKSSLSDLTGNLSEAKQNSDRAQLIQFKLDALSDENASLKQEQSRYVAENENLRTEVQSLHIFRQQNDKLSKDLQSANQVYKELQLKYEKLSKQSEDATEKPLVMEQAKVKLSKMSQERRLLSERCKLVESDNERLCNLIKEYTEQIEQLEVFRDELIREIQSLKNELQKKKKSGPEKDFREFVNLKRELNLLKEENEDLTTRMRSRIRSQSLLPALKGPEPKSCSDRRLSANSIQYKKP